MIMCIQNSVKFCPFILKIWSKNLIPESIKGCNSVANLRKTTIYNTNIDLVNDDVMFPPAPKKGMVRFSKKGTFNARRHAMRALSSVRQHAKRALKMNLFIYLQSKSLIVITVLFMLPADL